MNQSENKTTLISVQEKMYIGLEINICFVVKKKLMVYQVKQLLKIKDSSSVIYDHAK